MEEEIKFVSPGISTRSEMEYYFDHETFIQKLIDIVNENPNDLQLGIAFRKHITEIYPDRLIYEQK